MNTVYRTGWTTALLGLVMMISSAVATAVLIPVTEVREMGVDEVRLPAHEADRILLRRCTACTAEELRVTPATVYRVGGAATPAVTLTAFRNAVRRAGRKDDLLLLVTYAVDTQQVIQVTVSGAGLPDAALKTAN